MYRSQTFQGAGGWETIRSCPNPEQELSASSDLTPADGISSQIPTPLASLTKAIAAMGEAENSEGVIEVLRATTRSLLGCEGVAIIRRDGDLCHYNEEDAIGPLWKGGKFPASACISGWAMINRQTVVVPDVAKDGRIPYELYAGTFVRSLAMAPVRATDPIGALGAYWSRTYVPAQWEIDILEALAGAAATAILKTRAIQSLADIVKAHSHQAESSQAEDFSSDIKRVAGIAAVPTILDVVLRMTGMGFAAVSRVTDDRWITCQSLDHVGFGLKPGDELPVASTLCDEIRGHRQAIVFDDAAADSQYRDHHTPRIYGLRSYISMPIILPNGQFFGTLCAIDPKPAKVNNPQVVGSFKLFAELIAHHLYADELLKATQDSLHREKDLSELREQFIAVLGHDLRNPIAAVDAGTSRLLKEGWTARSPLVLTLMKSSIARMAGLVDNVMDLARSRLGGGIDLDLADCDLATTLHNVIDELRLAHPDREIEVDIALPPTVLVDRLRLAQLFSNLVANAFTHGVETEAVKISAITKDSQLEICVRNGGKPIPPETIGRLFQPFRRGDHRPSMQGLGLGLYIALEIAKAHDGGIEVKSDEVETCFTFTMPMQLA